jgi:hydrogenase maturation protease
VKQRVIACGQPAAGDDGVGFAVLEALEQQPLPEGVELCRARDTVALMPQLEGVDRVLVIDAAIGLTAGSVRVLDPEQLDLSATPRGASSHGIGVRQAIELSRALHAERMASRIAVLAVGIERPVRYSLELSPGVKNGVPNAAAVAWAWLMDAT